MDKNQLLTFLHLICIPNKLTGCAWIDSAKKIKASIFIWSSKIRESTLNHTQLLPWTIQANTAVS